ncbi:MAG: hypothetical protein LC641_10825 [Spirochaeta sp.]|nr:hypothetical protein [Spirochaeta sp.]
MKRVLVFAVALLMLVGTVPASAYRIIYREQHYRMFRMHLYQYPELITENIYRLEQALRADFANPLYALAVIQDERDWERYRALFTMHLNLMLVEQYLLWGSKYNKFEAYFFNAPWQKQNLESLERAEELFEYALVYWDEVKDWSEIAYEMRWTHLPEVQYWVDENHRIETGDLDYEFLIDRHLERLREVRERFESMGPDTY